MLAPQFSAEVREPIGQRAAPAAHGVPILAIDPGPVRSGVVSYHAGRVLFAVPDMLNGAILAQLQAPQPAGQVIAIETMQANYAATVGASVIDTLIWIGRFMQATGNPDAVLRIPRQAVKQAVCGNVKANDAGVRQALIDRLGLPGTKRNPGPTYGVTSHAWAALAVAVAAEAQLQAGAMRAAA